jgi:hypothetical protein
MKTEFACLEQRMVNTYLDTFPSFVPSETGPGTGAQEQFHQFMHGVYQRLSREPALMFSTLHEDDAHTRRFNKGADNKPKLKHLMRRAIKQVDALLMTFFQLGQSGQVDANTLVVDVSVSLTKKHRILSEQLGLHLVTAPDRTLLSHDEYAEMFQAWTWMATRPGASLLSFSRCLFRESYPYARDIYARLSGNEGAFRRLERYLIENRYTRMDNWDGTLTLDYYKTHRDKAPTKGGFQYGIRHTGISSSYDLLMDSPPVFGLCIPRMKEILTAFDSMTPGVQDFVVARTKQCDGCRYCVQTDKTGKRPLARITVSYDERELRLCPYFPGYRFCWTSLSDGLVDDMIAMLGFMDRLFDVA